MGILFEQETTLYTRRRLNQFATFLISKTIMSETIRLLAEASSFTSLQEKLDKLKDDYSVNPCEDNMGKLCELIELSSKVQGQLFTALNLTATQGGTYGGIDTLKCRLLPWLGNNFVAAGACVSPDTSLSLMKESFDKDRLMSELKTKHDEDMLKLEVELNATMGELKDTRTRLDDSQHELEKTKDEGGNNMLTADEEIAVLRVDLRLARDEAARYKREVNILRSEKCIDASILRSIRSRSPSPILRYRSPRRSVSPLRMSLSPTRAEITNSIRHSRLVARFNDLYAVDRLDMQDRLRRYVDCDEMVKRIIFIAVCESFHVAKMAYRSFRLRARKLLSPVHGGPASLEEAVSDYIVRNLDLYDVEKSVDDVVRSMNVNPKISFPPECEFALVSPFIRECCRVAYEMQALEPTLDIPLATDGELMSEVKYRRSYDSEFTAPLIAFHVWPALMEDPSVLIKGEATTRRGARSRSRSRARSCSPRRRLY